MVLRSYIRSAWVFLYLVSSLLISGSCARVLAQTSPLIVSAANAALYSGQTSKFPYFYDHSDFVLPDTAVFFVTAPIKETINPSNGTKDSDYKTGLDVLEANVLSPGNQLWVVTPNGSVRQLFPLSEHKNVGLIDAEPSKGSVGEVTMSVKGDRIYFSYAHDAGDLAKVNSDVYGSKKGMDIYELIYDPTQLNQISSSTIQINRFTYATQNKFKDAVNPTLANSGFPGEWGLTYLSATDMVGEDGTIKIVYVSDQKWLMNSNGINLKSNRNFNLYISDYDQGKLRNTKQFQYYTTTSVMSPTRLDSGIAFSYQATTEDSRNWAIQGSKPDGYWFPIGGYGDNPTVWHLGSYCIKNSGANPGKYFASTLYYNANNNGFGAIKIQDLSILGQNKFVSGYNSTVPTQIGLSQLTLGSTHGDFPSSLDPTIGAYYGKFTSPSCGRPDQIYLAYSPTSANERLSDNEGNQGIYDSAIVFRNSLDSFYPTQNNALKFIVDDLNHSVNLIWPTPALSWAERTGEATQDYSSPESKKSLEVVPGLPHAVIGTSALWNTDIVPADCHMEINDSLHGVPFSPNTYGTGNVNAWNDSVFKNINHLSYVQDFAPYDVNRLCKQPLADMIFGVAVNLTSNKTDITGQCCGDYTNQMDSSNNAINETTRLLGVVDVRNLDGMVLPGSGKPDQSFRALIPANVPFDLHLLHRKYGLKLADVRSWHSLKPGEERTNCGGCHNHKPGEGQPFEGSYGDTHAPVDLVNQTPYIDYDPSCNPVMKVADVPALENPEFKSDIYPGLNQHCGNCHNLNTATDPTKTQAQLAFKYQDPTGAYFELSKKEYLNRDGALQSQAFWAARGERTDGRDNNFYKTTAGYAADYANGKWGFQFWQGHQGLCNGTDQEAASWVYKLGLWIDNLYPLDTSTPYGVHFDRYHPTVDAALASDCSLSALHVGYWDDTGDISKLTIERDDGEGPTLIASYDSLSNGSMNVPLPAGLDSEDVLKVIAIDPKGNRQIYEKSIDELLFECTDEPVDNGGSSPTNPTPSISPTPDPIESSATLMINGESFGIGDQISFMISAKNDGPGSIVCSLSGTQPGTYLAGTKVNLNQDTYFNYTLASFSYQLVAGQANFQITVPKNVDKLLYNQVFSCQAVIKKGSGIKTSNLVSFQLQQYLTLEETKKAKKKIKKLTNKIKKANYKVTKMNEKSQLECSSISGQESCLNKYKMKIDSIKNKYLSKTIALSLGKKFFSLSKNL